MTRLLLVCLALSLLVGFAVASDDTAARHRSVTILGVISGFDPASHTLTLTTQRGDVAVLVGRRTRVAVDGQPARLSDLEIGMRAAVTGRPDLQNRVFRARAIRARS